MSAIDIKVPTRGLLAGETKSLLFLCNDWTIN